MERALAARPSTRAAARALLADAGVDSGEESGPVVHVSAAEWDAWFAVQIAAEDGPALVEALGSLHAAKRAIATYRAVNARLDEAQTDARRPARIELSPGEAERDREWLAAIAREKPPRMPRQRVLEYSARRARELGFEPADLWAKQPGARRPGLKDARAVVVTELRDLGATLATIGVVFGGRRKESVLGLERQGRKQKGDSNG